VLRRDKAHGFNISDISYIFITHCEHSDHSGNVAPILRESRKQVLYSSSRTESLVKPVNRICQEEPASFSGEKWPRLAKWNRCLYKDKILKRWRRFDLGNSEKFKDYLRSRSSAKQPGDI